MKRESIDPEMVFKVGKHSFYKVNYIVFLSSLTNKSKGEIKRLFKQKAIDIYIPE